MYKSKFAYVLAMGKPVPADKKPECEGCVAALESHGFCKECDGGIVAHRWYQGQAQYEKARKALADTTRTQANLAAYMCPKDNIQYTLSEEALKEYEQLFL